MIGNNFLDNKKGFTLAEMLVTVGVFSIAVMISSAIFINVNKLQQNTANLEKLQNDGRYTMERIVKEIRGREIDYSQLVLDEAGLTDKIVFKEDEFGEVFSIFFDSGSGEIKMSDGSPSAGLNSEDVMVQNAKFIVAPQTDPYANVSTEAIMNHPRVTIKLSIKNRNVPEDYQKVLNLQTTVSSKVYR